MGNRYQKSIRPDGGARSGSGKSTIGKRWADMRARLGSLQDEENSTFNIPDAGAGYHAQSSFEDDDDRRILRHRPGEVFNSTTGTYTTRNSEPPRRKIWPWIVLAFAAIGLFYFAFDRDDMMKITPSGNPPAAAAMANTNKPADNYTKQNNAATNAPVQTRRPTPIITKAPDPTPTSAPVESSSVLKYGSKGEAVKNLQDQLIALGYIVPGENDGAFGDVTLTAVKSFQKVNGLENDGIAGEKTLTLLESGTAKEDPDIFVWVENKGKVYHSTKDCSNLKDPKQIKLSQAEKRKQTPCEECH